MRKRLGWVLIGFWTLVLMLIVDGGFAALNQPSDLLVGFGLVCIAAAIIAGPAGYSELYKKYIKATKVVNPPTDNN